MAQACHRRTKFKNNYHPWYQRAKISPHDNTNQAKKYFFNKGQMYTKYCQIESVNTVAPRKKPINKSLKEKL
jgi:hypothetical protein